MDTILEDVFDARDLLYRPLITPLPPCCEPLQWPMPEHQIGQSCVGYALSNMIEIVLREARTQRRWSSSRAYGSYYDAKPSALMLYNLARRYDERVGIYGTSNGTSLRAGLKGWYHHGVALNDRWREHLIDDDDFRLYCQERPLGAYYRVNPFRVDDVQSAICETSAVVATMTVPGTWVPVGYVQPQMLSDEDWKIATNLHALVLIGYDRKGFLALNSYGPEWGVRGTSRIPYGAWLRNAVDTWVARVGVPGTLLPDDRTRGGRSTLDGPSVERAPDHRLLKDHVVSLGLDGGFSQHGRYVSSADSMDAILANATSDSETHQILVWFHDSLISDDDQRWIAEEQITWWKANGIYPIYISWRSLFFSQLFEDLGRTIQLQVPITGVHSDMRRQVDRLCEIRAERHLRSLWKELIGLASGKKEVLRQLGSHQYQKPTHLVAAGNGCHLLIPFTRYIKNPKTIAYLYPTCTVSQFCTVKEYTKATTVYLLRESYEAKAGCDAAGFKIHSHSFLTLVARSLQEPELKIAIEEQKIELRPEADIVGLARRTRDWDRNPCGGTRRILAPSLECRAETLREFTSDPDTLDSLAARILENTNKSVLTQYLAWRFD